MPRKYASLGERILANTIVRFDSFHNGTPCWEWTGAVVVNRSGMKYGKLSVRWKRGPRKGQQRTVYAHRAALENLAFKTLRGRQVVMHLCNNTLCCNPAHLMGGTQRKNMRQMVKDGRNRGPWS